MVDCSEFDAVLESCRRFLLAVATKELPNNLRAKGGASDLVQQTLASAVRSEHQFRGRTVGELRAWLRAILLSEAAVFRRRYSETAARDVGREVTLGAAMDRDDRTPGGCMAAIQAEQTKHLSAAVALLPFEQRQTVALRMEDQLSFAEIGVRLGRSEEAARKLFSRALDRLRFRLTAAGDED